MSERVIIGGVAISHPDKILFEQEGISKRELAQYYADIAQTMLPWLKDRPLSLERYPDGIGRDGFYHKQAQDYFPDYVETVELENRSEAGTTRYALCQNRQTLVYLAQLGCITPHSWLSRKDKPDLPDRMIFDLDPASDDQFDMVIEAARILKPLLEEEGLTPFVMTTGSRGLHVVVPIRREHGFDAVREKAEAFAGAAADTAPKKLTTEIRKNKRGGRLFLDIARNAYGQTGVPPYAVRARPGAPVATPLDWEELNKADLTPDGYTIRNISRRLAQKPDPWRDMARHAASLPG